MPTGKKTPDPGSRAPAHAREAEIVAPPTVLERVRIIRAMMLDRDAEQRYRVGETSAALAELWGLDEKTVQTHAAEAARSIVDCLDPAVVQSELLALLREAAEMARAEMYSDRPTASPAKASQALAQVVKLYADITGNAAPQKVEHSGPGGGPIQLAPVIMLPRESED